MHLCHEENGTDSGGEGVVGLRRTSPGLRGRRQHQRRGPGSRDTGGFPWLKVSRGV